MRVLWFTNTPSNFSTAKGSYGGGGWICSLETEICEVDDIELAIAFYLDGEPSKVEKEHVTYYPIPTVNEGNVFRKNWNKVRPHALGYIETNVWPKHEQAFLKVINDFKPDIIQIFGSENSFVLIADKVDIPVVLHIQGVLTPCFSAFLPPFVSWSGFFWGGINLKTLASRYVDVLNWRFNSYREQKMFKKLRYFIGRTIWDERVTKVLNPDAQYLYGSEILRSSFYEEASRILPQKFTIITTISSPLYKGFDLVLKTAYLLKYKLGLDFEWKVYGNINPSFIEKVTKVKHEQVNVLLMGVATPEQLRNAILNASVYVHTSYIDNSPNSLCEAQMLSCPVVSTNVGGIPSLIEEGKTGFMVPSNDSFQMAYLLNKLFEDKELNIKVGLQARETALQRHDKKMIVEKLVDDYKWIINDFNS